MLFSERGVFFMLSFEYFTESNSDRFAFFQIPKELFTKNIFSSLSTDSKILYGILLDRVSLSRYNNWIDDNGHVYIIFKQSEIMSTLNCSKPKATKLIGELLNIGLIEKHKQGPNMPDIIYVKNFNSVHNSSSSKRRLKKFTPENGGKEIEPPKVKKVNYRRSNNLTTGGKKNEPLNNTKVTNTDINQTELSYTESSKTIIIKDEDEQNQPVNDALSTTDSVDISVPKITSAQTCSLDYLPIETRAYIAEYAPKSDELQNSIADFVVMRKQERTPPIAWLKMQLSALESCLDDYEKLIIVKQTVKNSWKNLPTKENLMNWQEDWSYHQKI